MYKVLQALIDNKKNLQINFEKGTIKKIPLMIGVIVDSEMNCIETKMLYHL